MKLSYLKYLLLALISFGIPTYPATADTSQSISDRIRQKAIDEIGPIPKTKVVTQDELAECYRFWDEDVDYDRSFQYYRAFDLMFNLEHTFIFRDEARYDVDNLNRLAEVAKQEGRPFWLDYSAYGLMAKAESYIEVLNSPENFLKLFDEMDASQGIAPCYFDYTRVRNGLSELKDRVQTDLIIQENLEVFEEQVSGKNLDDLNADEIGFLNSILADKEIALSEVRFAAYNIAGLLLIRSKDRGNKQKAIYFWEYAALKGQSVDAMLNLFIHREVIEKSRFISIAETFSPNKSLNDVGLFRKYSPRLQGYDVEDREPTPQNTLLLASHYMQHPEFEWRRGNEFMWTVEVLTYAGKNQLKKYVEEQSERAQQAYEAEKTVENLAFWAAMIGTTVAAIGQLSDGSSAPSTTSNEFFSEQTKHIDDVMVGAYAISLD